ncbi:branched-chain amino acid ABC transporter permease [Bradyrhizobium quebecense]|uniref:Branched-chain amino acid ABC transporter permease n=2 Tax=Bradyrhizobium quebecense TaxID=2748629 RepID=A0ACD3V831_9BRAD|nr:branched-chain amino acid ABC transporter permease [Bradyrhizobium quebecense]UGY02515.1 branched-chain amino acid ABC transporter permease [Bradyrhizobium quebecense]
MLSFVIAGLIPGCAYALLAISITVTYRTLGVLNFSQTAIGVFGAYVGLEAAQAGLPQPFAALVGLASGGVIGLLVGILMVRWFNEANSQTRSAVTIVLMLGIFAFGARLFGRSPRAAPQLFPDWSIQFGDVSINLNTIIGLVTAFGVAAGVTAALKWTRIGICLSAVAERPKAADLLGIPVGKLSLSVWGLSGIIAAGAITFIMPTRPNNFVVLGLLLLPALAASLFGLFRQIYLAVVGGIILGIVESCATNLDVIAPYRAALPFVIVLVILLWSQRREVWDAAR